MRKCSFLNPSLKILLKLRGITSNSCFIYLTSNYNNSFFFPLKRSSSERPSKILWIITHNCLSGQCPLAPWRSETDLPSVPEPYGSAALTQNYSGTSRPKLWTAPKSRKKSEITILFKGNICKKWPYGKMSSLSCGNVSSPCARRGCTGVSLLRALWSGPWASVCLPGKPPADGWGSDSASRNSCTSHSAYAALSRKQDST